MDSQIMYESLLASLILLRYLLNTKKPITNEVVKEYFVSTPVWSVLVGPHSVPDFKEYRCPWFTSRFLQFAPSYGEFLKKMYFVIISGYKIKFFYFYIIL